MEPPDIIIDGFKMTPMDEKDMVFAQMRVFDIKCAGCGEEDHKNLDTLEVKMTYGELELKVPGYACYACGNKIKEHCRKKQESES